MKAFLRNAPESLFLVLIAIAAIVYAITHRGTNYHASGDVEGIGGPAAEPVPNEARQVDVTVPSGTHDRSMELVANACYYATAVDDAGAHKLDDPWLIEE